MSNTKWLSEISYKDISLVGGKNCSLGEMIQNLTSENINIPSGFAVTTLSYDKFLSSNNLTNWLEDTIKHLPENIIEQRRIGMVVRSKISNGTDSNGPTRPSTRAITSSIPAASPVTALSSGPRNL